MYRVSFEYKISSVIQIYNPGDKSLAFILRYTGEIITFSDTITPYLNRFSHINYEPHLRKKIANLIISGIIC